MGRLQPHLIERWGVLILALLPYLVWVMAGQGYALQLTNRSISVSTAVPSAASTHTISFVPASTNAVGSIVFEYCDSPLQSVTCTAPPGLSLSGANLASQSGNIGFTIDTADSTATKLVISRPAVPASQQNSVYSFAGVANPSGNNQTTFVRISTYASTNGSGSYIDYGAVAFSTSTNLSVGAYVPPYLNVCAGVTVAADCSSSSGTGIDFGILSAAATRSATSQFAVSTNSVTGYAAYILGTTMTSGNNVIPALATPSLSRIGQSQFGLNLRANSSPRIGSDPDGNGTATPASGYNSPNLFTFVPGSAVADSTLPTAYNRMTSAYIVNVSPAQPPGVYATTLTYLATAQF